MTSVNAFPERQAISVSQLNQLVKDLIDGCDLLSQIAVRGEISNLVIHRSGHVYFSLKDEGSLIRAVMFRSMAARLKFMPKNGMKVVVYCSVSAYVKEGQYQLYVTAIEPDGIGSLYLAFEQLKASLAKEGLFDAARKKPIPKIPSKIGLITSPTGAAVRDMIRILGRRFPFAEVFLYPALVQGIEAPKSLQEGIRFFDAQSSVDVIIIGRGGGSAEDLFAFNDEGLAREIAACHIPIISAVGHETDFTICDFVADLRAATPSAAAELAVPETMHLLSQFENVIDKMQSLYAQRIDRLRHRLEALMNSRVLTDADALYENKRMRLLRLEETLTHSIERTLLSKQSELKQKAALLDGISPLKTLARGYALPTDSGGRLLRNAEQVEVGDTVYLRLYEGSLTLKVFEKSETKREEV
ncbi:MAG: exodeoxyribonuclease VII large subunit [Clostridia bacterium]|nr:exodeoxyribonuclease VII large subunit [Clostridia bacterium]